MNEKLKEEVEKVYNMSVDDFVWKPLYPNNMTCNGLKGYYSMKLHSNEDGTVSGRKYTILFQHKLDENGCSLSDIDLYIFFEKSYYDIKGSLEHPEPNDKFDLSIFNCDDTLTANEVNDYGSFIRACKSLDEAKELALRQYKMIYGYVMSHFI